MDTLNKMKLIKFVEDNGHCWIEFDKVRAYKMFFNNINLNRKYKYSKDSSYSMDARCYIRVEVSPLRLKVKVTKANRQMITVDSKESDLILPKKVNAVLDFSSKKDRQAFESYHLKMKRHSFDGMDNVKLLGVNENGK